ncbi:MAG TPA: PHB depolymerase family esterase, partial [Candidatus Binataceae bacterium]|nr:PHB depolymerase family esterase [Candidatus Binataceae bacterium]
MPLLKPNPFRLIVSTVLLLASSVYAMAASPLQTYRIAPSRIVIAGISSGGAMAVQMSVAYSRLFSGAAIYAGVPYYCAQDSEATALTSCEQNVPAISLAPLESTTEQYAKQGLIDPLSNLREQRIYLWSGLLDVTVRQPVMNQLEQYYTDLQ